MTQKIRKFLEERRPETPCLVVDLDVVARNYHDFARYSDLTTLLGSLQLLLIWSVACLDVINDYPSLEMKLLKFILVF